MPDKKTPVKRVKKKVVKKKSYLSRVKKFFNIK